MRSGSGDGCELEELEIVFGDLTITTITLMRHSSQLRGSNRRPYIHYFVSEVYEPTRPAGVLAGPALQYWETRLLEARMGIQLRDLRLTHYTQPASSLSRTKTEPESRALTEKTVAFYGASSPSPQKIHNRPITLEARSWQTSSGSYRFIVQSHRDLSFASWRLRDCTVPRFYWA